MKTPLIILFVLIKISAAYAQPSAAEYSALIDFYNSTGGPNWLDTTGWSTANPNVIESVANWYGIRTDAQGHVTDIDFDGVADFTTITNSQGLQVYTGNNLNGTLPTTIGNLTYLQTFNVGGNQLTGPIPEEIGQLTNLVKLIGSTNQFTGKIPSSIGNLTKLDAILMELNQLSDSIPSSIGNLTNLWALLLNNNQLTGPIPDSLGNLKKLRFFYLYNNQLTGPIPNEIGTMTAAYRIGLHNNQLTGTVPASLANLSNLQLLYLSGNQLEGDLPAGLSGIGTLTTLVVSSNNFTFSSLLQLKNTFGGTTFRYWNQNEIDEEKTFESVIGGSVTLTTAVDRNTVSPCIYQWFKIRNGNHDSLNVASTDGHSYLISNLIEADAAVEFYYTITNPDAPFLTLYSRPQRIVLAQRPSTDQNYIRTIDKTVASTQVDDAPLEERIINYTYFDGLGRPMQQVAQQGSPLKNDIVTPIVYDEFGRESRKYLPIVSGNNGSYIHNGTIIDDDGNYNGIADAFYSKTPGIADDPRLYSETLFEPSPLNRPEKDYGTGLAWAAATGGNDKPVKYQYMSNLHSLTEGAPAEAIIAWKVDEQGLLVKEGNVEDHVVDGGYYDSNQIYIKATFDEHGNAVREYTNKQGQIILKKVQVVANSTNLNNVEHWACTYYIYDDLGNLRFVLPPEGVKQYLEVTAQN